MMPTMPTAIARRRGSRWGSRGTASQTSDARTGTMDAERPRTSVSGASGSRWVRSVRLRPRCPRRRVVQLVGLVLDVRGDLAELLAVLAGVVGAEQQLAAGLELHPEVGLGTASVAPVTAVRRPGWGQSQWSRRPHFCVHRCLAQRSQWGKDSLLSLSGARTLQVNHVTPVPRWRCPHSVDEPLRKRYHVRCPTLDRTMRGRGAGVPPSAPGVSRVGSSLVAAPADNTYNAAAPARPRGAGGGPQAAGHVHRLDRHPRADALPVGDHRQRRGRGPGRRRAPGRGDAAPRRLGRGARRRPRHPDRQGAQDRAVRRRGRRHQAARRRQVRRRVLRRHRRPARRRPVGGQRAVGAARRRRRPVAGAAGHVVPAGRARRLRRRRARRGVHARSPA